MVLYVLTVSGKMERLVELKPQGANIPFFVKIKCTTCGEEGNVSLHLEKTVCMKHKDCPGRKKCFPTPSNTRHMLRKCRFCEVMSSIVMVEGSGQALHPLMEKAPVMVFDCKGCEPISFTPSVGWEVTTVDMSTGDFIHKDADGQRTAALGVKFTFEIMK